MNLHLSSKIPQNSYSRKIFHKNRSNLEIIIKINYKYDQRKKKNSQTFQISSTWINLRPIIRRIGENLHVRRDWLKRKPGRWEGVVRVFPSRMADSFRSINPRWKERCVSGRRRDFGPPGRKKEKEKKDKKKGTTANNRDSREGRGGTRINKIN